MTEMSTRNQTFVYKLIKILGIQKYIFLILSVCGIVTIKANWNMLVLPKNDWKFSHSCGSVFHWNSKGKGYWKVKYIRNVRNACTIAIDWKFYYLKTFRFSLFLNVFKPGNLTEYAVIFNTLLFLLFIHQLLPVIRMFVFL